MSVKLPKTDSHRSAVNLKWDDDTARGTDTLTALTGVARWVGPHPANRNVWV